MTDSVYDQLPAATLWDLDGTLVDTEPAWIAAEEALARLHGVDWIDEDRDALVGSALTDAAAIIRGRGVKLTDTEIIGFLIDSVLATLAEEVPWQPGALELLTELRDAAVPCALVTASYRDMADQIVAGAPEGVFGAIVAGDEVTQGKPHPEPYRRAAELLGVDIARCVAFEDSPTGLASAEASGARVVGIESQLPVSWRPGRSRLASLDGFTLADVRRVAAGEVIDQLV